MKVFLKFKNRKLENAFITDYNRTSLNAMRLGCWFAIFLYAIFGILDILMMPVSHHLMWFIRFIIIIPLTFIVFLLTYVKSLRNYMQIIISFNAVSLGLGIISMIAVANENEPGFKFYYAGLMLVIMGIASLFRLRFFYALFSSSVIILGYELTAIFIQKISGINSIDNNFNIFISNNFFFISANIIGLMAAYYLEYFMRVEFLQQEEIIDKHRELNTIMESTRMGLALAKHIQSNLFPASCPYLSNIKIHSLCKPMEDLAGDFYDFIRFVESNFIGIFISDVSGHGIPAALIASMLKTLNITAGNNKFFPSEFLKYINSNLAGLLGDNFLTAIYMLYNSESREMKFSRVGHPYPLLIRNGTITELKSRGVAIGLQHEIYIEECSIIIEPGDKLLLYTDGLTEEINSYNTPFEDTFFNKVLPSIINLSIEEIVELSYQKLVEYKGDEKLSDDVCIVGIEIL